MNFLIIIGVIDIILLSIVGYLIYRKAKERDLLPAGYVIGAIAITITLELLVFIVALNFKHDLDNFFYEVGFGIDLGRRVTALTSVGIGFILGLFVSYLIVPSLKNKQVI